MIHERSSLRIELDTDTERCQRGQPERNPWSLDVCQKMPVSCHIIICCHQVMVPPFSRDGVGEARMRCCFDPRSGVAYTCRNNSFNPLNFMHAINLTITYFYESTVNLSLEQVSRLCQISMAFSSPQKS